MTAETDCKTAKSIYDFTVKDTHGKDVPLEKYRGQVCVIVNTASLCQLTQLNHENLANLKKKYEDKGVKILAFPCNQFASNPSEKDVDAIVEQLKESNSSIGDTFQTIDVNGDNAEPLFKYLTEVQGAFMGDSIKWNFTKFIIDKQGRPVDRFGPLVDIKTVEQRIDEVLALDATLPESDLAKINEQKIEIKKRNRDILLSGLAAKKQCL